MIPNPILKVLSTMSCHTVRHLLIGGQACVLYGAAEFSRDCDIVILAEQANFEKLNAALAELRAECIAIPEFNAEYLERGHAVHFRCGHPDVDGLRIDVMSKLRGCDPFELLCMRALILSIVLLFGSSALDPQAKEITISTDSEIVFESLPTASA